jgi:hypothetical protein
MLIKVTNQAITQGLFSGLLLQNLSVSSNDPGPTQHEQDTLRHDVNLPEGNSVPWRSKSAAGLSDCAQKCTFLDKIL